MPTATVTVREVRNKESGLDLSVPSYKETQGLFGKNIYYQVVAVSRLQCFKSPKHKETDVVQFTVEKQYEDFETLKKNLWLKCPGTVTPNLPKSLLDFTKSNVGERKVALERFLSALASTAQLAHCHVTLEFLGVNPITAGKFTAGEGLVSQTRKSAGVENAAREIFEESKANAGEELFGDTSTDTDIQNTDDNIFLTEPTNISSDEEDDDDIFTDNTKKFGADKLFSDQDLGGAVQPEEEDMFLVPGAKDLPQASGLVLEDNSQLLTIEDDLDQLLKVSTKVSQENVSSAERPTDPLTKKPAVPPSKPEPPQNKPSLKAKPPKAAKPTVPTKPATAQKPKLQPKPSRKSDVESSQDRKTEVSILHKEDLFDLKTDTNPDLEPDDILKYIQENADRKDNDLDLFS